MNLLGWHCVAGKFKSCCLVGHSQVSPWSGFAKETFLGGQSDLDYQEMLKRKFNIPWAPCLRFGCALLNHIYNLKQMSFVIIIHKMLGEDVEHKIIINRWF